MQAQGDIREFLSSRRARLTPDKAGLPAYGGNRRVPGLRREEVAMLAGVSVDYYNRLERGNISGASDAVLESLADALQFDEAERAHLFDLARRASGSAAARRRAPRPATVRPVIQQVLDSITDAPAWVRNARHDHLAHNQLGRALYSPILSDPRRPANSARFVFLDPASHDFFVDWERAAADIAAMLRSEAGRHPHDQNLRDLVGELSTCSEDFRQHWAAHDVRFHRTGIKQLRHPVVGEMTLNFEAMELSSDADLTLLVYTADPGTPSADALRMLATWAATEEGPSRATIEVRGGAAAKDAGSAS